MSKTIIQASEILHELYFKNDPEALRLLDIERAKLRRYQKLLRLIPQAILDRWCAHE